MDENGAQVALALVEIIVKEVAEKKERTFGYTTEQIVSKVEQDSSVLAVIEHLLKEVKELELERLLVYVLPRTYFEYVIRAESDSYEEAKMAEATLSTLAACFRRAFDFASDSTKRKVARNFVRIVKEEGEAKVLAYEANLFRATDLQLFGTEDAQLVKQHVLARIQSRSKTTVNTCLELIKGIGPHVDEGDASTFADCIMQMLSRMQTSSRYADPDDAPKLIAAIVEEHGRMSSPARDIVRNCVEVWSAWYESGSRDADAQTARSLLAELSDVTPDDIPF